MAATYDDTLATARDRLRYRLGDIILSAPLLSDASYDYALDTYVTEDAALAYLLPGLITRFSQLPDSYKEGGLSVSFKHRISAWNDLLSGLSVSQGGFDMLFPNRDLAVDVEYLREVTW
jgi:hypothetical protein